MVIILRRKKITNAAIAVVLTVLLVWTLWGNTALELNSYAISDKDIPAAFDGFRIVHLSDFHNTQIGKDNGKLLAMIAESEPDLIAITGDMIDSYRTDVEVALHLAEEAVKIAPCYYVPGNHEARIPAYKQLKEGLQALGVVVMEDACVYLEREGDQIALLGVRDPNFPSGQWHEDSATVMDGKLRELAEDEASYTILLSHRPELFNIYVQHNMNLVLTGHAHGGQFRFPLIGGLVAPNQGWFPQYDGGLYTEKDTNMLVSRGIGNSIIPLRFNNRPELILIELDSEA